MSTFDPLAFVNVETTEAATRRPPIQVGDYLATVGKPIASQWFKDEKSGIRLSIPLKIEIPPEQKDTLRVDQIQLTDSVFIDTTDNGSMDWSPGKNGGLRRYREALDMNKPGEAFSPARMEGRMLRVKVNHDLYNGEIQERPAGVAKV